jgi:hypothetical protein
MSSLKQRLTEAIEQIIGEEKRELQNDLHHWPLKSIIQDLVGEIIRNIESEPRRSFSWSEGPRITGK